MSGVRLATIMSKPVFSIRPKADLDAAHAQMTEHHVHHLVVTDANAVLGILSTHDLERKRSALYEDKWLVEDIMSEPAMVATPEMTTAQAAALMRGSAQGCLPIVDGDKLVGIVTTSDLLDLLARS